VIVVERASPEQPAAGPLRGRAEQGHRDGGHVRPVPDVVPGDPVPSGGRLESARDRSLQSPGLSSWLGMKPRPPGVWRFRTSGAHETKWEVRNPDPRSMEVSYLS
jgi:hypothetical protein